MSLEVLKPGPLSLIQDFGRRGQLQRGMSPGGPVDEQAFLWANKLLENDPHAAMLEITLGPFHLRADTPVQIALTGADMHARRNGEPLDNWCSHSLQADDVLELGQARHGLRAYLAVQGGLQCPLLYGSCATVQREQLGGLHGHGKPLEAGNVLPLPPQTLAAPRSVPSQYQPDYNARLTLRLLPGYQWAQFDAEQRKDLLDQSYLIASASNRMAYRLEGHALQAPAGGLISEGIAYGAVQVPPDGQPIVLLKDRQSIGGYPKLGCISSLDAAQLAQRRPGQSVCFALADLAQLHQERQQFERFFALDRG